MWLGPGALLAEDQVLHRGIQRRRFRAHLGQLLRNQNPDSGKGGNSRKVGCGLAREQCLLTTRCLTIDRNKGQVQGSEVVGRALPAPAPCPAILPAVLLVADTAGCGVKIHCRCFTNVSENVR